MEYKERFKQIVNYNFITENTELEISEAPTLNNLRVTSGEIKTTLQSIVDAAVAGGKGEIQIIDASIGGGTRSVKDADELFKAMKGKSKLSIDAVNMERINIGLLKSIHTPQRVLEALTRDITTQQKFLTKYAKFSDDPVKLEQQLRKQGYSQNAINVIKKDFKPTEQQIKDSLSSGVINPTTTTTTTTKGLFDKLKRFLSGGKKSWKQTLMWAGGFGIGGVVLWNMLKNSNQKPTDFPPEPPKDSPPKNSGGNTGKTNSIYQDWYEFPYPYGTRSEIIKDIQIKLGMEPKYQTGNFGPITLQNLKDLNKYNLSDGITKEIYDDIMKNDIDSENDQSDNSNETPYDETQSPFYPKTGNF
jgi:hypothetical protein